MERPDPASPPGVSSIAGAIALVVIGLVVLVPSGLCTGFFFLTPIIQALEHPNQSNFTLSGIALVVGGPFVVGGFSMLWYGVKGLIAYSRNRR